MSAVDRSRGRTHNKSARVCPLQFWRISAIFADFSVRFPFPCIFNLSGMRYRVRAGLITNSPGFFPLYFWRISAIFWQIFEGVTNRIPSAISVMVKFRSFLILFMFGTFSFSLSFRFA